MQQFEVLQLLYAYMIPSEVHKPSVNTLLIVTWNCTKSNKI